MRLIDADELLQRMKNIYSFYREHCEPDARSDEMIASQAEVVNSSTVEAIPIDWIEKYNTDEYGYAKSIRIKAMVEYWRAENE